MQQPTDESVGQRKDIPGAIARYCPRYIALVAEQYNIFIIALQWPLIRPHKAIHIIISGMR